MAYASFDSTDEVLRKLRSFDQSRIAANFRLVVNASFFNRAEIESALNKWSARICEGGRSWMTVSAEAGFFSTNFVIRAKDVEVNLLTRMVEDIVAIEK